MTILDELNAWKNEHKFHSVVISHDNGYGACGGWEIKLDPMNVLVYEWACNGEHRDVDPMEMTAEQEWPGLEWVIRKALELARAHE